MAQIYTRVYTYTSQRAWLASERSVPFSGFTVSGATDKNIGQIVSLRYEHQHSCTTYKTWTLTGRLVLTDGTTIDSAATTLPISKNTVVQFTNDFTTLPTAEQFAQIASIQTLDDSGSPGNNGTLTWKASAERPIRLIVEFYDQPPTRYAPQIPSFAVERVNASNIPTPEGTYLATTLRLTFASGAPTTDATVKLYTSTNPDVLGAESNLLEKVGVGELITGITLRAGIIDGQYSAGSTFYFTVVVSIGSETATAAAQAFRAKAPIHITNYGVSFGGFSSATQSDPKEEFHNPVVFHKGFRMGEGSDILTGIGIQHGKTGSITISASKVTEYAVTFPQAFSAVPNVVATFDSTGNDMTAGGRWDYMTPTVCDVTAAGFKLRIKNGTDSTFTLPMQWIAVGIP